MFVYTRLGFTTANTVTTHHAGQQRNTDITRTGGEVLKSRPVTRRRATGLWRVHVHEQPVALSKWSRKQVLR